MLRLRPYKPSDAKLIADWANQDVVVFKKWSADRYKTFPITADDINEKYFNSNGDCDEPDNFYPFIGFNESGVVAHMTMRFTDKEKRVIRFGYIIVDNTKRGQGIGTELLNLAVKYAFDILKVDKISLGVFDNNENAEKCYSKFGFVLTGEYTDVTIFDEIWRFKDMEFTKQTYGQKNSL